MAMTTFEKGFAQGIEIGTRQVVERLLVLKFGTLSEAVRERLGRLPLEQLSRLGTDLLSASSLAELGLQDLVAPL